MSNQIMKKVDSKTQEMSNQIMKISKRVDSIESMVSPIEQMAQDLNHTFQTEDKESFWKSYDIMSLRWA